MKAQRRHELKENELAKVITKAPTFWQESGGKFLAGAIVVLVIVILIQYRASTKRQGIAQATQELTTARRINEEIQTLGMMTGAPAQEMATRRRVYFNDANDALARAMQVTDDPKLQAEALVAKGDINWSLATLPPIPGAASQPTLLVRDPKDLLANANEAYQAVLSSFPDQKYAAIAARFGLAAIAENRGDFDAAKAQYEKVAVEAKEIAAYQQLASHRLTGLADLRKPVILAAPTTARALPASTFPATPLLPPKPPATTQATTTRAATTGAATTQSRP